MSNVTLKQCFVGLLVVASYVIFFVLGGFFASSTQEGGFSTVSENGVVEKCQAAVQLKKYRSFTGCLLCTSGTTLPRFGSEVLEVDSASAHLRQQANSNNNNSLVVQGRGKPRTTTGVGSENKAAFDKIYSSLIWSDAGGGSGVGSDPEFAKTAGYLLQLVFYKYGVTSLLDAPCGAVSNSWTRQVIVELKRDIPCFRYHGVDVVESVIQKNAAAFTAAGLVHWAMFSQADLSLGSTLLPRGYDVILSRDALQHLTYKGIAGAVDTYCRSDAAYLLVGSYLDLNENKDLASADGKVGAGGCFSINLRQAPFSFPDPLESFAEKGKSSGPGGPVIIPPDPYPRKHLLLYRIKDLCQSQAVKTFTTAYKSS